MPTPRPEVIKSYIFFSHVDQQILRGFGFCDEFMTKSIVLQCVGIYKALGAYSNVQLENMKPSHVTAGGTKLT